MTKLTAKKLLLDAMLKLRRGLRLKQNVGGMLIFGSYSGIKRELIPASNPVHRELTVVLERCRSFAYDLKVFQSIEPETRYLSCLTDPQKTSLDIGANIGLYSAVLSPLSANVIAWEANPHLISYLTINTRRYPNVRVLPFAAAKTPGEAVFNIPLGIGGDILAHSGSGGMRGQFMESMGIKSEPVKVIMLPVDALGLDNVGFMKIDVEGSEHDVLEGAAATIGRCRPSVIVENEFRHNPECHKVFEFLITRGYRGYFFDRVMQKLKPFEEFSLDKDQRSLLDGQRNIVDFSRYVYNFMFVPGEADRLQPRLTGG